MGERRGQPAGPYEADGLGDGEGEEDHKRRPEGELLELRHLRIYLSRALSISLRPGREPASRRIDGTAGIPASPDAARGGRRRPHRHQGPIPRVARDDAHDAVAAEDAAAARAERERQGVRPRR